MTLNSENCFIFLCQIRSPITLVNHLGHSKQQFWTDILVHKYFINIKCFLCQFLWSLQFSLSLLIAETNINFILLYVLGISFLSLTLSAISDTVKHCSNTVLLVIPHLTPLLWQNLTAVEGLVSHHYNNCCISI